MALQFGFNEAGELEIQGYMEPRNGEAFTEDEVREAYVSASRSSEAMRSDHKARVLFNEFVKPNRKQRRAGVNYQVFTWDEDVPEHLAHMTEKKLNRGKIPKHRSTLNQKCTCCQTVEWIMSKDTKKGKSRNQKGKKQASNRVPATPTLIKRVYATKKYKPVALKVRPVYTDLPERFRIQREIKGDPLKDMPGLATNPTDFAPTGRYTLERKEIIDKIHAKDFLWLEEKKLLHNFMMVQNEAFAWDDSERGSFRHDFFPPVEIPVVEHKVWVERSIPIPRGQLEMVCDIIRKKIDAGVYEPSNASYRTKFFGVVKKDGKSIWLVHALEPLNKVTSTLR